MNYDKHVLGGILTYPLAVLIISLLKFHTNLPIEMSFMAMALGYVFYVLGSDLPDIDHQSSLIHHGIKPIVSVAVGISAFVYLSSYTSLTYYEWANVTITWIFAVVIAFASWHIFTKVIPKHRGIVHTSASAFVYAVLAFAAVKYGFGMAFEEALFIGLSSFLGYNLHLVLDKNIKLI
ncbi:MAG: metal-dependent hydrolase [Methanotrichaceae archaeon]